MVVHRIQKNAADQPGGAGVDRTGATIPLRRRPDRATLRVAIVDGRYEDFLLTRRSLQRVGGSRFLITYADCLEAGYALLRNDVFDVALIASDLQGKSGLELIRRLGGRAAATPLILLAGGGDSGLDAEAMSAGAIDYLDKSELDGSVLERTIRYARHTHALEARLHVALRDASQANAAKSDFLARMSHDLRTPLNAILGFSEVVRDQMYGPVGSTKYAEYASHIYESGRHLLTLIDGILDLSRIEAGRLELTPELVDIASVIAEAMRLVQRQVEQKGLGMAAVADAGIPCVVADRRAVMQILVNLLSNAVKYTPVGGRIEIAARLVAGEMCVTVADSGIGIAPEDMETVLQPFGQGRQPSGSRQEGCGLGLSIVKSLIEMHDGCLEVESRPSVGTAVTIRFPRNRLAAEALS